jgi:hypothetical protein
MGYDAFVSYSHAADGQLAPALVAGLRRFARTREHRHALRIFRDETNLAVNPNMWGSIEGALKDSAWFVLLCSPQAAASRWVNREIDAWAENKPVERILPVLTEGTMQWDPVLQDFTADSTAVPPALRGRLAAEPRYLDMRWARSQQDLDPQSVAFRASIAALAAPILGVTREDLDRKDRRIVIASAFVLVALLAGGLVFALSRPDSSSPASASPTTTPSTTTTPQTVPALTPEEAAYRAYVRKVDDVLEHAAKGRGIVGPLVRDAQSCLIPPDKAQAKINAVVGNRNQALQQAGALPDPPDFPTGNKWKSPPPEDRDLRSKLQGALRSSLYADLEYQKWIDDVYTASFNAENCPSFASLPNEAINRANYWDGVSNDLKEEFADAYRPVASNFGMTIWTRFDF